jgi:hypothetical protein
MLQHGPDCLEGPRSRVREWWTRNAVPVVENAPMALDSEGAPIRWDLVSRVRREIADGTYDTLEKMEEALRKLQQRFD